MRGCGGKLCFTEKERGKVWKNYIESIMNEENDWDHNVKGDAVEGPVVCLSREEVLQALNEIVIVMRSIVVQYTYCSVDHKVCLILCVNNFVLMNGIILSFFNIVLYISLLLG